MQSCCKSPLKILCSVYGISDTTFGSAEIPFFIFPAKGSLENPYKNAMVDDFWKNSKKSIFASATVCDKISHPLWAEITPAFTWTPADCMDSMDFWNAGHRSFCPHLSIQVQSKTFLRLLQQVQFQSFSITSFNILYFSAYFCHKPSMNRSSQRVNSG